MPWGRRVQITVTNREGRARVINNFGPVTPHISFTTEKTLERRSNQATISLLNMNADFRNFCEAEMELFAQIETGYAEPDHGLEVLFTGDIIGVTNSYLATEWVTTLQCGDATRRLRDTRMSFTYRSAVTRNDLIYEITRNMELSVGYISPALPEHVYRLGYTGHGYARHIMSSIIPDGFMWSVQDGQLVVVQDTEGVGTPSVLLTPETGLIGVPERSVVERRRRQGGQSRPRRKKKNGIKFSCWLNPILRPGTKVVVIEEKISDIRNTYVLTSVRSQGSVLADSPWAMECEAIEKAQPVEEPLV